MNQHRYAWMSKPVMFPEEGVGDPLATKALCVVLKHCLIPFADNELKTWSGNDHYRHRISELEDGEGDAVWVKPWIVGAWIEEEEQLLSFDPAEFADAAFEESMWEKLIHFFGGSRPSALFGLYLTVARKEEGWSAVFGFRLDGGLTAKKVRELPVAQVFRLALAGPREKVEAWLDRAYAENS
ncbi:MAG: hypothetical protein HQL51_12145 [Magnetococcales bacterium]|nr:hypothetical protein [Magnetococcales bacterium]